jgi:hypothetical protein
VLQSSFISSSYLTRSDVKCSYDAFEKRRWLVIEGDTGTREQQFWIHRRLAKRFGNLGCVCYSGGKSLHGWFFVEGWTEEECFELYAEAMKLGINDLNTWKVCQPVRLPNAMNKKTLRKQQIYVWNV